MTPSFFIGIDIAKATFDVCISHDTRPRHRKFANTLHGFTQMWTWIGDVSPAQVHIAMEATGRYHLALANWAYAQGACVHVINPCHLKHYARSQPRRTKTDRADAALIALYLTKHTDELRAYQPPREAVLHLRELARRRDQLLVMLKQETNRDGELDEEHVAHQSHERLTTFLRHEIKEIDTQLAQLIAQDEALKRDEKLLRSIPQVGKVLAVTMLAELGEVEEYARAKDVTAWLGLAPLQHQSGTSVHRASRIGKGNTSLRKVLYMAALGAMSNTTWKPWIDPQVNRGKTGKKLLVALMDKLARVCWGVLKNRQPFDPKLAFPS